MALKDVEVGDAVAGEERPGDTTMELPDVAIGVEDARAKDITVLDTCNWPCIPKSAS